MPNITRRNFLRTTASASMRIRGAGESSIGQLLKKSDRLHRELSYDGEGLVDDYFTAMTDNLPPNSGIDTTALTGYLLPRMRELEYCLMELVRADNAYARKNGEATGPFAQLLEIEKRDANLSPENQAVHDAQIASLLKKSGIDKETWQNWAEHILESQCERTGLQYEGGFIDFVTGRLSEHFMDCVPCSSWLPSHVLNLAVEMAQTLHRMFPVTIPLEDCPILSDTLRVSPESIGEHTQKVIERRKKGDLLPFELDHYGRQRPTTDVY